jgi:putative membrane protein
MFSGIHLAEIISTIFYTGLGVALMALCWWLITRLSPFPVVKEIEQDQNVALAILIAAVFLSLAIIIAAVLHSA